MEPYVKVEVLTPSEYNGQIIELGQERRGILLDVSSLFKQSKELKKYFCLTLVTIFHLLSTRSNISHQRGPPLCMKFLWQKSLLTSLINSNQGKPPAFILYMKIHFHKTGSHVNFLLMRGYRTQGYASMEYSLIEYRPGDLVRLDVKINYEDAAPLATIVHVDAAQTVGRRLVASLKDLIPRQMFKVPIQACIGVKIIASASIPPVRKDVLAKCYGGDITRKKKLLQKQAKGKKRMKAMGKVSVPQEAFMAVIKLDKSAGN